MYKILVLNLGGTSTKLSLYEDEKLLCDGSIRHTSDEIEACKDNNDQIAFRKKVALNWINENHIDLNAVDAAVLRIHYTDREANVGGTFRIVGKLRDVLMKEFEESFPKSRHPSYIAYPTLLSILEGHDIPIYAVDPDGLDEFCDVAHVTGHPDFFRISGFHVLNHKAIGRKVSADLGKTYAETKLVIAHLGGGVSIASHDHGRVIDSTCGGPAGEGPFSTTRAGALPIDQVALGCCSGKYDASKIMSIMSTNGGFLAHTGMTDMRLIEEKAANGDANCDLIVRAFIYQVCRYIGAQFAALGCEADAIVLTGGIAYDKRVVAEVTNCVGKLAPVMVYPGEDEAGAMVAGVLRVLRGEEAVVNM